MREEILMRKVFTMLTFLIIVLLLSLSPPDTAAITAGRCSVSPSPPLPRITQKKKQCKLEAVVYCSSLATVSSYNSLATVSLYNSLATFLLYNSLVTVSLHNSLAQSRHITLSGLKLYWAGLDMTALLLRRELGRLPLAELSWGPEVGSDQVSKGRVQCKKTRSENL